MTIELFWCIVTLSPSLNIDVPWGVQYCKLDDRQTVKDTLVMIEIVGVLLHSPLPSISMSPRERMGTMVQVGRPSADSEGHIGYY